jgi:hypothetical protein
MLNEFKRPMWNDGYSKEQPWLNYFNSYERMHCCFDGDGDGSDDGGAGDEAAATTAGGTASAAADAAASEASYEDAMGAQAEGAASTGMDADQAQQVFDAIDKAAASGASQTQQQNIAEGGNRGAAGGYTGTELGQIAAANIDTDFFNDANTLGVGAGFTSGRGSFVDPNSISNVGQTDLASYLDDLGNFAGWVGENFTIGGALSAAAREFNKDEKDVTKEDLDKSQDYSINRSAESPLEAAAYAAGQATVDKYSDSGAGLASYGQGDPGASYNSFFDINDFTREDDRNIDAEIGNFGELGLGADFMSGPGQPGYGGAALGGMTDAELQAGYAQEARDMSSAFQPDEMGFNNDYDRGGEDAVPVLPVLPTPEPEEKKEPETAMEAYFTKLGIASPVPTAGPVAPSSFQEYRSYLPPIGPADNAAYRRKLALGTPRYQEPSGPNPSISTLAAVYGLTYEEAAKKFAFPSVPKPPSLPVLTTFAASGGGLNSLMRYK